MAFNEMYQRQVRLLIRVLPHVAEEVCFALKGGTAINLFMRDMPRLSVDIDLTYLPVAPRDESLLAIDAALKRIAERIRTNLRGAQITASTTTPENAVIKLLVRHDGAQVKIEVTPVLRGCVYEPELRSVATSVEEEFGFAEIQVVSFADLYAGKIVAALDRQHPRDFFDIRYLLAGEGIGSALRRAFIVYLLSHNRPMAEILAPVLKSITDEFLRGFVGMTSQLVSIEELEATRSVLITAVVREMPVAHRHFLMSFEGGKPEWELLDVPGALNLPAVRWRQHNLDLLSARDRATLLQKLEAVLFPQRG